MTAPLTRLRRGTATAAAAAALLVAVAACGSSTGATTSAGAGATSGKTPLAAVQTGFQALADSHALTVTVTVDATAAQLAALAKAEGHASGATTALAEKLLPGGKLVLEATSAGASFAAGGDAGGGSFSLAVDAGGKADLIQLDALGDQLYARADVGTLASDAGPAARAAVQSFVSAQSSRFPFVSKAVDGDWLHVDGSALLGFLKGGASASPSAGASALAGLGAQLGKDVTVRRLAPDPTLGDHLVVTGDVRTLGKDVQAALGSAGSALPGAGSLLKGADAGSLPDEDVSVDVYVAGGAVDAIRLDLAQLLPQQAKAALDGAPLDVEIAVSRTASISAPTSATTVTTPQLLELVESLGATGSFSLPGSTSASS